MPIPLAKPPQRPAKGFTSLYRSPNGQRYKDDPNARRLASLIRAFGLLPSAVARVAKVSPAYISRVTSGRDTFVASDSFWRSLEARLPDLVASRPRQFFRIPPLPVRSIERALADLGD